MTLDGATPCSLETADPQRRADGVERVRAHRATRVLGHPVDGYRIDESASVPLPDEPEQVCLALDGRIRLLGNEPLGVPRDGVGCVPAGVRAAVRACDGATVVAVERTDFEVPETADVATAHPTNRLGCRGVKCNARRLRPGQRVPYHTEGDQEELFVPTRGRPRWR